MRTASFGFAAVVVLLAGCRLQTEVVEPLSDADATRWSQEVSGVRVRLGEHCGPYSHEGAETHVLENAQRAAWNRGYRGTSAQAELVLDIWRVPETVQVQPETVTYTTTRVDRHGNEHTYYHSREEDVPERVIAHHQGTISVRRGGQEIFRMNFTQMDDEAPSWTAAYDGVAEALGYFPGPARGEPGSVSPRAP